MTTDTEIRGAFHAAVAPDLAGLSVSPGMLTAVRRRHTRQQRRLLVGAPLAIAVITAAAILGAVAIGGSPGRTSGQHNSYSGRTRALLDGHITLPAGWIVQDGGPAVTAFTAAGKPEGQVQALDVQSGDALQDIAIEASSGRGARQRSFGLSFVKRPLRTTVDGQPATFGTSDSPRAAPVQAGVRLANGDYLGVEAQGMTVRELEAFLDDALAGS
jgi:hypothetical protein